MFCFQARFRARKKKCLGMRKWWNKYGILHLNNMQETVEALLVDGHVPVGQQNVKVRQMEQHRVLEGQQDLKHK